MGTAVMDMIRTGGAMRVTRAAGTTNTGITGRMRRGTTSNAIRGCNTDTMRKVRGTAVHRQTRR